jgi:hypothetical protein
MRMPLKTYLSLLVSFRDFWPCSVEKSAQNQQKQFSIPVKSMSINLGARNALNFVKHLAQVRPGQWRKMQALRGFMPKTMHGNVAQVLRVCYN